MFSVWDILYHRKYHIGEWMEMEWSGFDAAFFLYKLIDITTEYMNV